DRSSASGGWEPGRTAAGPPGSSPERERRRSSWWGPSLPASMGRRRAPRHSLLRAGFLLAAGGVDAQALDQLVLAPLGGVVGADLQDEVARLFPVTLAVELDVAGDALELHRAH